MKILQIILAMTLVASIALPLSTLASPLDERMILGEWKYETDSGGFTVYDILIFNSDGTGTNKHGGEGWENVDDFSWKISDGLLILELDYGTYENAYEFGGFYSELTLTDTDSSASEMTYEREGNVCCSMCCGTIFIPFAIVAGTLMLIKKR